MYNKHNEVLHLNCPDVQSSSLFKMDEIYEEYEYNYKIKQSKCVHGIQRYQASAGMAHLKMNGKVTKTPKYFCLW